MCKVGCGDVVEVEDLVAWDRCTLSILSFWSYIITTCIRKRTLLRCHVRLSLCIMASYSCFHPEQIEAENMLDYMGYIKHIVICTIHLSLLCMFSTEKIYSWNTKPIVKTWDSSGRVPSNIPNIYRQHIPRIWRNVMIFTTRWTTYAPFICTEYITTWKNEEIDTIFTH